MEKIGSKPIDSLVHRAIVGDATAFTQLWDLNAENLSTYIRLKFKELDDFYVDDIVSRSFEKAFRQIGTYNPELSSFHTWLRTIAYRTAIDVCNRLQKENRVEAVPIDYIDEQIASSLDVIIQEEDQKQLIDYIEALPELYREVARKRLIEGLKYQEIAQETALELNTVRTRIRRAKDLIDKRKKEDEQ